MYNVHSITGQSDDFIKIIINNYFIKIIKVLGDFERRVLHIFVAD